LNAQKTAYGAIVVLALAALGLAGACLFLWQRANSDGAAGGASDAVDERTRAALDDPEVKRQAVAELVARGIGGFDTFADPAVGRLWQPNLKDIAVWHVHISTDQYGLRERDFALVKPPDTLRVVFLGDSFVMGTGVEVQDRLGTFFEKFLNEQAGAAHGPIECLHFGVHAWNTLAETAWLRRQLGLVRPDLVVHVMVKNDMEDNVGARGFGSLASFNPLHPERGDGVLQLRHPQTAFGTRFNNWLESGLDWESRTRFEQASAAICQLAHEVERGGGRYLLLDYFSSSLPASRRFITSKLKPEQVCYLPTSLSKDERYRVEKDDPHWNRAGHELVAKMLYALVQQRALLPQLGLKPWPAATAVVDDFEAKGRSEAEQDAGADRLPARRKIDGAVDFAKLDDDSAAQVHGGVLKGALAGRGGLAGPYASLILRSAKSKRLHVVGAGLARPELDGVRVEVFVEETSVGSFAPLAGQALDLTFDVPLEIAARSFVTVRFVADDWVYGASDLRQHVVFELKRVGLE
jgi:lysophospholipase L1-like esterase